jgi:hypothetical protein
MRRLYSGDICPKTGAYKELGRDGKLLGSVFVGEGETMPNVCSDGGYYEFDE